MTMWTDDPRRYPPGQTFAQLNPDLANASVGVLPIDRYIHMPKATAHDQLNAAVAEHHARRRSALSGDDRLSDAVAQSVAERVAARDTVPAPQGEYVVVRDCFRGCEYLAESESGEVRYVTKVEEAERFTKPQAELTAKRMGNGWRAARPL